MRATCIPRPPVPRRDQRPDHCCALASADRLGCANYGKLLHEPADSGRLARWCSPACRQAAHRRRERGLPQDHRGRPLIKSPCQRCGTVIAKDRPDRWCSRTCRDADYSERRRASRSRNPPRTRQPARIRPHDGATCGLCGAPLNRANLLAGAHKNAARPPIANAAELTAKRNTPPGSAP